MPCLGGNLVTPGGIYGQETFEVRQERSEFSGGVPPKDRGLNNFSILRGEGLVYSSSWEGGLQR